MKNIKQKNKGIILGLLLVSLMLSVIYPLTSDSNSDIGLFEFSHFPKSEELKNPSVAMQIRIMAHEKGFKWPDYLVNLAHCESRLDPFSLNGAGNYPASSVDRGVFQINSYWHKEVSSECAFDIECSTIWTMDMINNGNQNQWVCDEYI